jgi:3-phosphoshikimate 1-carboxyvinyltransferase
LGAIAKGSNRVENLLPAADCLATLRCIQALGVSVEEISPTSMAVHGRGLHGLQEPAEPLNCMRSGTTMRLLAGILAGQTFFTILTGDVQLRRRPMGRITNPLCAMGATVLGRDGGRLPPLALQGGSLIGLEYQLPVASAQVKSALLLAGLYAGGPIVLQVPGPARDHTERMLAAMGGTILVRDWSQELGGQRIRLEPAESLQPVDIMVPGDFSSAAFLVVAATLVPRSEITLKGVGVNPTRTGLLDVLLAMGAQIVLDNQRTESGEPVADLTIHRAELHGTQIGGELVVRAIDEFPALAVAATQAHGETIVHDAAELRVKETDRIATTVRELRLMGAEIESLPDGFCVYGPTPLYGAKLDCHGDHRLAMALAVAGLLADGESVIQDVDCIGDSYPGFSSALAHLGGRVG